MAMQAERPMFWLDGKRPRHLRRELLLLLLRIFTNGLPPIDSPQEKKKQDQQNKSDKSSVAVVVSAPLPLRTIIVVPINDCARSSPSFSHHSLQLTEKCLDDQFRYLRSLRRHLSLLSLLLNLRNGPLQFDIASGRSNYSIVRLSISERRFGTSCRETLGHFLYKKFVGVCSGIGRVQGGLHGIVIDLHQFSLAFLRIAVCVLLRPLAYEEAEEKRQNHNCGRDYLFHIGTSSAGLTEYTPKLAGGLCI